MNDEIDNIETRATMTVIKINHENVFRNARRGKKKRNVYYKRVLFSRVFFHIASDEKGCVPSLKGYRKPLEKLFYFR